MPKAVRTCTTPDRAAESQGGPPPRGYTPNELARLLRVSPDAIRGWIASGELPAIDTSRARCGRPRYVILPHHLEEFTRRRSAARPKTTPKPRRRRSPAFIDYFP
jgi:excisionase family DNA binding protein